MRIWYDRIITGDLGEVGTDPVGSDGRKRGAA